MTDEQDVAVRNALATYKRAQVEQAEAMVLSNRAATAMFGIAGRLPEHGDVVAWLAKRSRAGMAESAFKAAGAAVWIAAAELVAALQAAGFDGERKP